MLPRRSGPPRPVTVPSSDNASERPILTPAPSEAARPTKNALRGRPVSPAAAKIGASVETEPSISPSNAGWTSCNINARRVSSDAAIESVTASLHKRSSPARLCLHALGWGPTITRWLLSSPLCSLQFVTRLIELLRQRAAARLFAQPYPFDARKDSDDLLDRRFVDKHWLEGRARAASLSSIASPLASAGQNLLEASIAVFPTLATPIGTGLFLVRCDSTRMIQRISSSRLMIGSSVFYRASSVKSRVHILSAS